MRTTLMHDVPADIVAEAFARGEPRQSDTPFAEPWPLDEWPRVPTRVLAGRHDRLFPLEFMCALARDRLGVVADVIDTGHLPRSADRTSWRRGWRATASPSTRPGAVRG